MVLIKMKKNKVMMIGQKTVPSRDGGIETVLTKLTPELVRQGFEVVCLNRNVEKQNDEFQKHLIKNSYRGVKVKKVFTLRIKGLSAVTSSFFASIYAAFSDASIVHYHAEGPSFWIQIPKFFGKKSVVTIHGLDWKRDKWQNGIGSLYIRWAEKKIAKYADEIIVLNKSTQEYFKKEYDRQTTIIPNGISKPSRREIDSLKQYGLSKDGYICSVSRLTKEKNIETLIKAYKKIKTDKKLLIVGDSSDSDDYKNYLHTVANGDSNIIFTGFLAGRSLEEVYSNAYMFVIPSKLEGMPMALLEAMSFGDFVIGSDIPEIADILEEGGLLFDPNNVDDLAKKMTFALNHKEIVNRCKLNSKQIFKDQYNWDSIAKRTVKIYEKLCEVGNQHGR